jgi:hypothetical protein
MLVCVLPALLCTVCTNFGTQFAVFAGPLAISCHKFYSGIAGIDTLNAALGAVVIAFHSCHFYQAVLAIDQALLAGFYTALVF